MALIGDAELPSDCLADGLWSEVLGAAWINVLHLELNDFR